MPKIVPPLVVQGIEITARGLSRMCGIPDEVARHRIFRFRKGIIGEDRLFATGKMKRGWHAISVSDEWKRLSDQERECTAYRAGTWERQHIPDRHTEVVARRGRPESVDESARKPAYYGGQFRVNL